MARIASAGGSSSATAGKAFDDSPVEASDKLASKLLAVIEGAHVNTI
jgi:hypothetical protein